MRKILQKISVGFGLFLLPVTALAAVDTQIPQEGRQLEVIIQNVLNWFAGIIGLVALAMLLYAGFMYVLGGANPDAQAKAKTALTYAIVGLIVAFLAYSVIPILRRILGF